MKNSKSEEKITEYLLLKEADEFYAIETQNIETIIHTEQLRVFPRSPDYLFGTTIFKETLIPIFSLSNLLNIPTNNSNEMNFYIVVIKSNNEYVGLNVDTIIEIIEHNKQPRKDILLNKHSNHLFLGSIKLKDLNYLNSEKELVNVIDIQNIYQLIEKEFLNFEK